MMYSSICLLIAIFFVSTVQSQNCTVTPAEWTRIKDYMSVRNFVAEFLDNGDCNPFNPSGLLGKYRNCTRTLQQVVADQELEPGSDCISALSTSLGKTGNPYKTGEIEEITTRICTARSFGDTMTDDQTVKGYFCVPVDVYGCPEGNDILRFITFAGCHVGTFSGKSKEFIDDYFAQQKDIQCMRNGRICEIFDEWKTCPITVNQTISYLSVNREYTCENMFPYHPDRCLITFQEQQALYCPPLSVLEANLYTIAHCARINLDRLTPATTVTCSLGPAFLILGFYIYRRIYRAGHISDDDMLKEAIAPNIMSEMSSSPGETRKAVHPELQYVLKKSKYKGVKFDQATGSWYVEGMQRMFVNEKEAAQQAYLQNPEFHGPVSYRASQPEHIQAPPGLSAMNPGFEEPETPDVESQQPYLESPEERLVRRKAQLMAFYMFWDSGKPDLEGHVENLFQRHDFRYIMRAVKTKYGVVPPGWEEEAEMEESTI